jgi:hypothetical protein
VGTKNPLSPIPEKEADGLGEREGQDETRNAICSGKSQCKEKEAPRPILVLQCPRKAGVTRTIEKERTEHKHKSPVWFWLGQVRKYPVKKYVTEFMNQST